jgi:flagellar basal-body rod modification protein FlgD
MDIQSILSATEPQVQTQPPGTQGTLGKNDFLRLLVMQLRYQDPMNPLKGTEFAAQLAQFSSVEQLSNINTNLTESLQSNALLAQSINNALSATLIGKEVRATIDRFAYNGTTPVKLGYTLSGNAESVVVKVRDRSGNVIKTISSNETNAGNTILEWDGTDDNGNRMAAGTYSISVEAKDTNGDAVSATSFIVGIVQGVRFKSDGSVFLIDGIEVPLENIIEIGKG